MQSTVPPEKLKSLIKTIKKGDNVDIKDIARALADCGYSGVSQTEGKGEFSVHGGIIDIFPPHMENSVRIDLFDTEIESIRLVDPVSQRTVERVNKIEILPLFESCANADDRAAGAERIKEELARFCRGCKNRESTAAATDNFAPMADRLENGVYPKNAVQFLPYIYPEYTTLLDYMPENTLVVCDEPRVLAERSTTAEQEEAARIASLMEEGKALARHGNAFGGFMRFWRQALKRQTVAMQTISGSIP